MKAISIGSNPNNAADDLVSLTVRTGDTVVVTNLAGSPNTINYHSQGHGGGVSGTTAPTASVSLTVPGTHYLSVAGRAHLQLSGGLY